MIEEMQVFRSSRGLNNAQPAGAKTLYSEL